MKPGSQASVVLRGAKVISPERGDLGPRDVVITAEGKIAAVEPHQSSRHWPEDHAVVELRGHTLVPGLIDAHLHLLATGVQLLAIDLAAARSVGEILEVLTASAEDGESEWLIAGHLDDEHPGTRLPTLEELDGAFPKRPLFLEHRSGHFVLCNTEAARRLGLGSAVGANAVVEGPDLPLARERLMKGQGEAFVERAFRAGALSAARRSTTTIHAMEGGDLFGDDALAVLRRIRESLPTDVLLYWCGTDVDRALQEGFEHVGGDAFVDGTLGSRTAALRFPYSDDGSTRGTLLLSQDEVTKFFTQAAAARVQAGLHAIGNRAIEQAIRGIERAAPQAGPDARWRLEHCGDVSKDQLRRAAELGIGISTQPAFSYLRGGPDEVYQQRVGSHRARRLYPIRWMLDAGAHVAGGTDSPVTPPDLLLGLESCVNARYSAQRTNLREALQLFTSGAAWCGGEETIKGDIRPGMRADLVALTGDLSACRPDRIKNMEIAAVVLRGVPVCGSLVEGDRSWRTEHHSGLAASSTGATDGR